MCPNGESPPLYPRSIYDQQPTPPNSTSRSINGHVWQPIDHTKKKISRIQELSPPEYRIIAKLNRHSVGNILYIAQSNRNPGKFFVLKQAVDENNTLLVWQTLHEAAVLEHITQSGAVELFESAKNSEGQPWIVMDLLSHDEYICLSELVALPVPAKILIILSLARSIDAWAERGVFHRDLKSSNIFVDLAWLQHFVDTLPTRLLPDLAQEVLTIEYLNNLTMVIDFGISYMVGGEHVDRVARLNSTITVQSQVSLTREYEEIENKHTHEVITMLLLLHSLSVGRTIFRKYGTLGEIHNQFRDFHYMKKVVSDFADLLLSHQNTRTANKKKSILSAFLFDTLLIQEDRPLNMSATQVILHLIDIIS